jgi:hypothetical protein
MGAMQTNLDDIAAVTDVARAYYEGMIAGDEGLLSRAFHPRACIVGNYQGELEWLTLKEFVVECKEGAGAAVGPSLWRLDGLSVERAWLSAAVPDATGGGTPAQTARKYRFVTHDWMARLIGPPVRASNVEGREKAVMVKVTAPSS